MATKDDKERLERKREAAAAKIKQIAPHAEMMLGMLDETKVDMLLIALGDGVVSLRGED